MEYLMIIALAMGILVPVTYLFFNYSSESNIKIADSQVIRIGKDMISTAESVYFSGEGSKIVLDISMPEGVNEVYILQGRELVFNLTGQLGVNEAVFFSSVNMTSAGCLGGKCTLSWLPEAGLKKISLESISNGKQVLISNG